MFLVLKLSQFVLGGSYFFCCVYIDRKESLDVEIHNIHPYNSQS